MPGIVQDTQLDLTASELQILRQHQQIALSAQPTPSHSHNPSLASTRGRGTARISNSSSRAASNASSHVGGGGAGRVLLDAGSLQALGAHFERLMGAIERKVDSLNAQTSASISSQTSRTASSIAQADKEIARMRSILKAIDELETEYAKIRHIRDIVKSFRGRVEALEIRVDSKTSSKSAGKGRGGR